MKLGQQLSSFLRDQSANVIVIGALALPVVLGIAGVAVDYSTWLLQEKRLQAAADAAALAAARELYMAKIDGKRVQAIATSVAKAQLADKSGPSGQAISLYTEIVDRGSGVHVEIKQKNAVQMAVLTGVLPSGIGVRARANIAGGGRICVIGLDRYAKGTVHLTKKARITAPDCAVYSDSNHTAGMISKKRAVITSELACSVGGTSGSAANFRPQAVTDCPYVEDPLIGRPPPKVGACRENNLELKDKTITLSPGVYCGGLKIKSKSKVTLRSGVYIMKDGPLLVASNSSVKGKNVGIYFVGTGATFEFTSNSAVSLTAPVEGDLAGLLFYEDRGSDPARKFIIKSNRANMLLGTIYLPQGILSVKSNAKVADKSAYTAVVVRRIELSGSADLHLNADYDRTDVPVPGGIGPVGGNIFLTR